VNPENGGESRKRPWPVIPAVPGVEATITNALEGDRLTIDERIVPQTIFTTPEVVKIGLTHREVEASGVGCHVATHDVRGASNGRATGDDDGYLKLVFDARGRAAARRPDGELCRRRAHPDGGDGDPRRHDVGWKR